MKNSLNGQESSFPFGAAVGSSRIALVAETGADIPKEQVEAYSLHILPMHVAFGGEVLADGSFPIQKIYDYYETTGQLPKTSAVNPEDYRQLFERLHAAYPELQIVHLCYSAVTTCTMQNAKIASEGLDYVTHIDTKGVSAGQTAVVLRTAEYIMAHPEITVPELTERVQGWVKKGRMGFLPQNLVYLRAGGRVTNAAYMGAALLSLKPLIEIKDGALMSTKKYRGAFSKVVRQFVEEYLSKEKLDKSKIYLLFSEGLEDGLCRQLEQDLRRLGVKAFQWIKTGGVITTHSGPGAFGIAGFSQE